MINDVVIIGGGASGMMAAIIAAAKNKNVTIIEHCDKPGKKILMTGNGKCNYSNTNQSKDCYRCDDTNFLNTVLSSFSQKDVTDFFRKNGIATKNRNGYLYPRSGQATVINEFLQSKCEQLHVKIICGLDCKSVKKSDTYFTIKCKYISSSEKCTITARSVIISTGGKSYPKSGSDGSGFQILAGLGHKIIKPLPALTSLYCKEKFFKSLKGVRCDAKISLYVDNKFIAADTGELQLTDYGVSGIPVFQVSRYASKALDNHKNVFAYIDYIPEYDREEIYNILNQNNKMNIEQKLCGLVNKKIAHVILKNAGISEKLYNSDILKKVIENIILQLKSTQITIVATGDFEHAQICCGGVSTDEIDAATMQSKLVPNLYVTGEIIDVDGICGGYNLQWAWSTGYIAGMNC